MINHHLFNSSGYFKFKTSNKYILHQLNSFRLICSNVNKIRQVLINQDLFVIKTSSNSKIFREWCNYFPNWIIKVLLKLRTTSLIQFRFSYKIFSKAFRSIFSQDSNSNKWIWTTRFIKTMILFKLDGFKTITLANNN